MTLGVMIDQLRSARAENRAIVVRTKCASPNRCVLDAVRNVGDNACCHLRCAVRGQLPSFALGHAPVKSLPHLTVVVAGVSLRCSQGV